MPIIPYQIRRNYLCVPSDINYIEIQGDDQIIPSTSKYISISKEILYDIEEIDCSYNNIICIPDLHYIQYLNCSHNNITDIMSNDNLIVLDCSYNKIHSLTDTILPYIVTLKCDYNYITELPIYSDLKYLSIINNKLSTFPTHLPYTLQRVKFKGNPFTNIPCELEKYKKYARENLHIETDVNELDSILTYGQKIVETQIKLPYDIKYYIRLYTGYIV